MGPFTRRMYLFFASMIYATYPHVPSRVTAQTSMAIVLSNDIKYTA